jgi:large subunit ribosomal protein L23
MHKHKLYSGIDLIKYPIITDKSATLLLVGKYTFIVDPKSSKPQIKKAIEFLFDVKIEKINTCHLPTKKTRLGRQKGFYPHYKKAIITLKQGYNIRYFPDY